MIELSNIQALGGVLSGASLAISAGERVALLGANGSGKSTLLHCAVGLQACEGGTVRVDGLDPYDGTAVGQVRRLVGLVQQRPDDQIVATSVEDDVAFGPENLGLPREELRQRVDEALGRVGLTGLEAREPHTLSGGQKQRLVIAGTLALCPSYLLLDEATSQLDPQGRDEVLAVLAELCADGCGILQVTHDINEAALADRVAVLHDGVIVFDGSYGKLQTQREHFADWGIDAGLAPVERAPYEPHLPGVTGDMRQPACLEADKLSLHYQLGSQHTCALRDVSLAVSSGDFVVIRGATGSGKSTLLNVLASLLSPDTGTVTLDGAALTLTTARGRIGLIFQDPEAQLFAETVLDDVAFGPRNLGCSADEAHARARTALRQVDLEPELFAGRSPFLLSGGEARRAAIAGIVALRPQFILADEPTSGLDATSRDHIRALLASLSSHAGIVVVTHHPEQFADLATHSYELCDGVLVPVGGTVDEEGGVPCSNILAAPASSYTDNQSATAKLRAVTPPSSSTISPPPSAPNLASFSLYLPGTSPLHRADPRTKLLSAAALVIALFTVTHWIPILAALALVAALLSVARIPLRYLTRTLRPMTFILLFTLAANSITLVPTVTFSVSGLVRGVFFVTRLIAVMLLSTLVTLTTSPVALTDGITLLLSPLRRIRVPVDDLAMMLSIALRFIPTIAAEVTALVRAQTARGAQFSRGTVIARLRAWIPIIIPLLVQLFRRADVLALAMEARCYGSQKGVNRTRLRSLRLHPADFVTLFVVGVLVVVFLILR